MNRIALLLLAVTVRAGDAPAGPPSIESIVNAMTTADSSRLLKLPGYTSIRQYHIENRRFHTEARMRVELTVGADGAKHFRVLEMSGPLPVRKLVFQRMLNTETAASARDARAATRISPDNYNFRFVEQTTWQGRKCFVLEAQPKTESSLLFRGRLWVDAEEYAVLRIAGEPAQNPSFWVNKTGFIHEYAKTGSFWLPKSNTSETDVKVFGHTTVRIDYGTPRLNVAQ